MIIPDLHLHLFSPSHGPRAVPCSPLPTESTAISQMQGQLLLFSALSTEALLWQPLHWPSKQVSQTKSKFHICIILLNLDLDTHFSFFRSKLFIFLLLTRSYSKLSK
jgi:hypothetical protein